MILSARRPASASPRPVFSSTVNPRSKMSVAAALVICLAGCTSVPLTSQAAYEPPVIAPVSPTNAKLRLLPPPKERISVAVYDFEDQTGQYQEAENFQQISNSVTQGGAPILIKALQDAGQRRWFKVLERTKLADLLKERQIVSEMRRVYRGEEEIDPVALPPLDHAAIIIEGGIVGYNTNLTNGGAGARYLGIGANVKHARDEITVALRAVSTKSGEVLHSVTARKSVYSVLLQSGVFRFVKLDELLELEGGIAENEPRQIAVEAAIEKAVEAMILEGAELGIWAFKDPAAGKRVLAEYRATPGNGTSLTAALAPSTRSATQLVATIPTKHLEAHDMPARVTREAALPPPRRENEPPVG